jgi:hypothetical protein
MVRVEHGDEATMIDDLCVMPVYDTHSWEHKMFTTWPDADHWFAHVRGLLYTGTARRLGVFII